MYTCTDSIRDIDLFFVGTESDNKKERRLTKALRHMIEGSVVGESVSCQACWEYYQAQKRKYLGG